MLNELELLRDDHRTWLVEKGKRGAVTDHKSINAAKRHTRALKRPLGAVRTVASLKRAGAPVPA